MVEVGGIARERLQSFVERIERLEEEKDVDPMIVYARDLEDYFENYDKVNTGIVHAISNISFLSTAYAIHESHQHTLCKDLHYINS